MNKYYVELSLKIRECVKGQTKTFYYEDYELPLDITLFGDRLLDHMKRVDPADWESLPYDQTYLLLEIDVTNSIVYRFVKQDYADFIYLRIYNIKERGVPPQEPHTVITQKKAP